MAMTIMMLMSQDENDGDDENSGDDNGNVDDYEGDVRNCRQLVLAPPPFCMKHS